MAKWQRVRIDVPKDLKPSERKAVAQEIIDFIRERTQSGIDKNGKQFKGYKKDYAKKKGRNFPVDLTFTEEMLSKLDLISHKNGSLLIGYDKNDKDLNGKVEGNRLGTYGQKRPVQKPRDFLGITQKQLKRILDDTGRDDGESDQEG